MIADGADKWKGDFCLECLFCLNGRAPDLTACRHPGAGAFPDTYFAPMEAGEQGCCRWFCYDFTGSERERSAIITAIISARKFLYEFSERANAIRAQFEALEASLKFQE